MFFHTHERTPKPKTTKARKMMLFSCWGFMGAVFAFVAIAISVMSQSILPALILLLLWGAIATFAIISTVDMSKAYVQIDGDDITVVDYVFLFKRERLVKYHEIKTVKLLQGRSLGVRGSRYGFIFYIVFQDENNKYLFKVFHCPETEAFFRKNFKIQ